MTVSPIRHIKDGIVENSLSKATLRVACSELESIHENIIYFPSYELLMDDLRDYRFYDTDMLHPSSTAIEYVWEKFKTTFSSDETLLFFQKWEKLSRKISHISLSPHSEENKNFLKKLLQEITSLSDSLSLIHI